MMELYILRHAEAQPASATVDDASRELTSKGKRDVKAVLKAARAGLNPQVILSSPLQRALQTAEIASAVFGCPVLITDRLKPNAEPRSLWKEACKDPAVTRVLIVGHEPHLGRLLGFLLEGAVTVDLKKSSLARIDCPQRLGPPRGVLKWLLPPKLVR